MPLWRIEIADAEAAPLPAIDIGDAVIVIGSSELARVRLPASEARPEHVRIADGRWRSDDGDGAIGDGCELVIGRYRVRIAPAPDGASPASPQRTASLARELMRGLLGTSGAPTLEVTSGPRAGARRVLAPPPATLVVGRGDDAGWIIDDPELSRAHAEIARTWDGVWLRDLGSKAGTRLDGRAIDARAVELYDGALIELGAFALRFADPASRALGGARTTPAAPPTPSNAAAPAATTRTRSPALFYAALVVAALALGFVVWIMR